MRAWTAESAVVAWRHQHRRAYHPVHRFVPDPRRLEQPEELSQAGIRVPFQISPNLRLRVGRARSPQYADRPGSAR